MKNSLTRRSWTVGKIILLFSLSACGSNRVMYLGSGTTKTIQLRETIKGVKAWAKDSTGVSIPVTADLLEGGYYRNDLSK